MSLIVEEWTTDATVRVRSDPTCEMIVGDWVQPAGSTPEYRNERSCGRPATVRVNHWPDWSIFWCDDHAAAFQTWPRRWQWTEHLDIPTYIRRAER